MEFFDTDIKIGILALLIATQFWQVGLMLQEQACDSLAAQLQLKYEWTWSKGCLMETAPGRWAKVSRISSAVND